MLGKLKINDIPFLIIGSLIVIFLATHAPNVDYDSSSYINFDPIRPLVYPVFIWLFHFAGKYQFHLIIYTQGLLLFLTFLYARFWLKKHLLLGDFAIFLIYLGVLFTISFHYQLTYVQSEGVTFPLFILTFFLLTECFYQFDLRKITLLAICISLLILTRLQFYYFYGIYLILLAWHAWQGTSFRSILKTAFILMISIIITVWVDKTYHYFQHGNTHTVSYAGLMVLVQTLYLADNHSINYFENNSVQQYYLKQLLAIRHTEPFNQHFKNGNIHPSYLQNTYQEYSKNYTSILESIKSIIKGPTILEKNAIATELAKTLIWHNSNENLLFFGWKIIQCVGNIPLFIFYCLIILFYTLKLPLQKFKKFSIKSIFILLIATVTFLNALIVALCNPALPPYFCYTQFLLYCLAALLVEQTFNFS